MKQKKLNCVLVDDDPRIHGEIDGLMQDCPTAELTDRFLFPAEFLKAEPQLDFDICLLDIVMPELNGFSIAEILKKKRKAVIFISGDYNQLKFAIDMVDPIDVMSKPISKERLFKSLDKAYKLLRTNNPTKKKEFELFCIAGSPGKTNICLSDILFVKSDSKDPRNKMITLKNDESHIIMNCTFRRLLNISRSLIQVNRTELISTDAVRQVEYDTITLNGILIDGGLKQVTLSNTFRKEFMRRIALR